MAAVFVLTAIGSPLLGMRVFAASDLFLTKAPWASYQANSFTPENPWVGDTVDGVIPQTALFADRLRSGDFASWNPYVSGGGPLGIVPSPAVLSPVSLPWLALPAWLAPGYTKLLEMIITIFGMFLFLRRLRISAPASWLGGMVLAGSGFFVVWTNWPQTRVAALIPALFWAAERLAQERRIRDGVLLAAVVASMLLGGFPAVTGYALYAAAPYFLLRVLTVYRGQLGRILRLLAGAGTSVVAGALLVAGQLLPFVAMLQTYSIGNRGQEPFRHIDTRMLITTIAPWATGTMDVHQPPTWFGVSHPVESFSFLGAVVVVLALLGTTLSRRIDVPWGIRTFFVCATALTVVVTYAQSPLLAALQHLPVFSNNYIGRARSVLGFFVATLAAIGYDGLIRPRIARSHGRAARRVAFVVGAGVWLFVGLVAMLVWHRARGLGFAADSRAPVRVGVSRSVLFGQQVRVAGAIVVVSLACILILYFAHRRLHGRRLTLVRGLTLGVLPLLFLVQAVPVVTSFWPKIPRSEFYPRTPTHDFLAENLGHDRYVATGNAMGTGTASYYNLRSLGGHAFVEQNFADMIKGVYAKAFLTPSYVQMPADPNVMNAAMLDKLGVRYLITAPGDKVLGTQRLVGTASGTSKIVPDSPVTVALPEGGPLRAIGVVLSEPYATAATHPELDVSVLDSDGRQLASGSRRIGGAVEAGPLFVPLVAGEIPRTHLTVRIELKADNPMSVVADRNSPQLDVVGESNDGLQVVAAGAATVYERDSALPRIRWASSSVVQSDTQRALALVAQRQDSASGERVVLDRPGPGAEGRPASLRVDVDSGERITVAVEAQGAGYLVVADALQKGWIAAVDGRPATLRSADHGLVAVAVPSGNHTVSLSYSVPYGGVGIWISLTTGLVLVVLLVSEWWWVRRRRSAGATSVGGGVAVDDADLEAIR